MKPIILANCEVIKLREYSRSYGKPETIKVPYIMVFDKSILLINERGGYGRILRRGSKLLIDYKGTEISERAFKIRTNKARKEWENKLAQIESQNQARIEANEKVKAAQIAKLKSYFEARPDFLVEIKNKIEEASSKEWRKWVRMKCCGKLEMTFSEFELGATDIRDLAYSL